MNSPRLRGYKSALIAEFYDRARVEERKKEEKKEKKEKKMEETEDERLLLFK